MVKSRANYRTPKPSIPKGENMVKKKKKNAKRLLSAPDAAARKSVKPVLENPFENIYSRRKLDVIGKKRKGEDRRISLARSRAVEKRKKTLLKDYEESRKSSTFVDKRIGEADDALGEFDKGILRLQRERQLKLKKTNKYKLLDVEEDESALHMGKPLEDIDDFRDDLPFDDDESAQTQKNSAMGYLNSQNAYESPESGLLEEEHRHKTKKEAMEEVIAKSKFFKAQKAMEKEVDEHLTEKLDKDFASLLQSKVFLSLSQSNVANITNQFQTKVLTEGNSVSNEKSVVKEQPDAYDKLIKELPMERRARPSDRKKTAEEIAQDERERLESLEEARQKRMFGPDDSDEDNESEDDEDIPKTAKKKLKHISGDDLGDSLVSGDLLISKPCHVDDIVKCVTDQNLNDTKKDSLSDDADGSDDDDDDADDADDADDGNSEDDDSDDEDNRDETYVKDWEQSDEDNLSADGEDETDILLLEKRKSIFPCKTDASQKLSSMVDSLPFVIEAPKDIMELSSLVDHRPETEILEAINRIRICNAIKLSADNRRKMQVFYGVLLQYFAVLTTRDPVNAKLLNLLVKPLVEMGAETPYFAAICARERLSRIRNHFCEIIKNQEESAWPSLKTLFLLRLWSLTFPCSDFRHVVMTPVTLLMCEYLMRCPIVIGRDIAVGSFLCSMLLSVTKQSLKFYPEALSFLRLLLTSATERPRSQKLYGFFFDDFKTLKPWLNLRGHISSVDPVNFFSIMGLSADSPFFSSDTFRASILLSVTETLRGFVNIYDNLISFPEIFMPLSSLLDEVISQRNTPECLRSNMEDLSKLMKEKAENHEKSRRPLQMRKQKPASIKLLNPKFEEDFAKGRDYDPDRERVERKKLKKLLKKEEKGAVRELRKDNYFLHEVKEKERAREEEERAEMYGKARAFLQEQEHAYKSGQLGKGKKGRR